MNHYNTLHGSARHEPIRQSNAIEFGRIPTAEECRQIDRAAAAFFRRRGIETPMSMIPQKRREARRVAEQGDRQGGKSE